jgi:hypothetical protein
MNERKVIRILILLLVGIDVALVVSTYVLSTVVHGYLDYPYLYLSNTFVEDPARAISAFVLPFSGIIIAIVAGRHLWSMRPFLVIPKSYKIWKFGCGSVFAMLVGFIGVGAVTWETFPLIHLIVAFLLFVGAECACTAINWLTGHLALDVPAWLQNTRVGLTAVAVICAFVLAVTVGPSRITSAIAELIMVVLLILYFVTLAHSSSFPIRQQMLNTVAAD